MSQDPKAFLKDAKQWVEQERVWDDLIFAPSVAVAEAAPRQAPLAHPDKAAVLQALYEQYKNCQLCPLGATRIKFVFGVGNPETKVLFIGEGPGYEEDRRGEPFVGKAGQLLDKIMASIGLNRQNAYIANIVKCHPMQNPQAPEARGNDRAPNAVEVEACLSILRQQIVIIQPLFIVTLGSPSTRTLLQTSEGITKLRGRLFPFPVDRFYPTELGAPPLPEALQRTQVLPTYHPAALLRNPDLKKDVWTDMKLLRDLLR
ncbi:MAG: uracil-DNA glycosylase [Elusimicrobiota bacterium]|jgi:DNA polymerase